MSAGLGGARRVLVPCHGMSKDRVGDVSPGSEASRERDAAIRNVRDQLMQFMEGKLMKERRRELKSLGPDVACMVEGLAESMAMIHFDFMRALGNRATDASAPKLALVREPERKK